MTDTLFPATGHVYEARFGELAFRLQFDADGKTMRFAPADAPDFSKAEEVTYRPVAIRPGVFMVTWTEADKTSVTHVEDFENGLVHTNITKPARRRIGDPKTDLLFGPTKSDPKPALMSRIHSFNRIGGINHRQLSG